MYNKMVRLLYDLQALLQGLFCLVTPIALGALGAWLLVRYTGVGAWIYALLITLGTLVGLWSMVSFILKVSQQTQALERAEEEKRRAQRRAERAAGDHTSEHPDSCKGNSTK